MQIRGLLPVIPTPFRDGHFEASIRLTLSARAFALRAAQRSGGVN